MLGWKVYVIWIPDYQGGAWIQKVDYLNKSVTVALPQIELGIEDIRRLLWNGGNGG